MAICCLSDSILLSVKHMLGPSAEDDTFDPDIIIHTNTALNILNQLGLGKDGFFITGETETWYDFLGDSKNFEMAKTFLYLKVRLVFDPPSSSVLMQAMKEQIAECEWRICNQKIDKSEGGVGS